MVYQLGVGTQMQNGTYRQLTPETPSPSSVRNMPSRYALGRLVMREMPEEFGDIITRPVDRRENYVKRCVGLPGQMFEIKNDIIYLDGRPMKQPENVQFRYEVSFIMALDEDTKKELGITDEELGYLSSGAGFPMTDHVRRNLSAEASSRPIHDASRSQVATNFSRSTRPRNGRRPTMGRFGFRSVELLRCSRSTICLFMNAPSAFMKVTT